MIVIGVSYYYCHSYFTLLYPRVGLVLHEKPKSWIQVVWHLNGKLYGHRVNELLPLGVHLSLNVKNVWAGFSERQWHVQRQCDRPLQ